jgi:hypothetical protein
MRDRIRERLTEYRTEALERIGRAVDKTKSTYAGRGTLNSSMCLGAINEDNETGFAEYMDQSVKFIRQVAPGSGAEYADELRDGGNKLKQEIMAKPGDVNFKAYLDAAIDKITKRKVEDFEFGIGEGKDMNATTQNTVNIINSSISNSVVQITQSGKDAISKDTALKLQELVNSEEIKGLPDDDRLEVLDRVSDLIEELNDEKTDKNKVHRGLKRLGKFISSVGSKVVADAVAQLAVAWAKANGMIP